MATVTKDFRVKNGLVVEGTSATVNGSNVLTENSTEFIQDASASLFTNGTHSNIAFEYDDANNVINATVSANPSFTDHIVFEGVTHDSFQTTLQVTDPTADQTITLPNATGTVALTSDITSAVDAITTDVIEEGSSNLYFTNSRAALAAINLLTGPSTTKNNIQITTTGGGDLTITAENGVADSTTDDLAEGTSHLYFTNQRALDATSTAYDIAGAATTAENNAKSYADSLASNYDIAGAASTVQGNLDTHISDTSTHGVSGDIVGTSDSQSISNKVFLGPTYFQSSGGAGATNNYLDVDNSTGKLTVHSGYDADIYANNDLTLTSNNGNIVLNPDGFAYLSSVSDGNKIATNSYVDNAVAGLTWKQAVNLLAHTNLSLTGDATSTSVDGHSLASANGYRIVLTNQSTSSENGIYDIAVTTGTYTLTRSTDADAYTELIGAAVFVIEGSTYGQTSWVQSNHYLTDFSSQTWTQFSGSGSVVAGTGITVDGLTISIDRTTVDTWYDGAGSASTAETNANTFTTNAINALSTTDIEEGTNLYFTNERAQDAVAQALANGTHTNITVAYDDASNAISLTGAVTYTDADARNALSGGTGITYNPSTGQISVTSNTYDAYGAASTAQSNAESYASGLVGNVLNGTSTFSSVTLTDALIGTATLALTNTTETAVDSWSATLYSGAKYIVQMKKGNDIEILEILVAVDGNNNVYLTEYADVISNVSLGTTNADYSAGNVRLLVTASNGTTVKVHKTLLEA